MEAVYFPANPARLSEQERKALRQDYFLEEDCRVLQNPQHFCFNADSFALASFCRIKKGERIAEIGTNNGALLVYFNRFAPSFLCGMEILEAPARLAARNLETSASCPWAVVQADVRRYETMRLKQAETQTFSLPERFDLVVCNPPFFPLSDLPSNAEKELSMRQLGRFEQNLDLASMVEQASGLLRSNGRFCFVHRPEKLAESLELLKRFSLQPKRLQIVYDRRNSLARAILLEAVKEGSCHLHIEPPFFRQ